MMSCSSLTVHRKNIKGAVKFTAWLICHLEKVTHFKLQPTQLQLRQEQSLCGALKSSRKEVPTVII